MLCSWELALIMDRALGAALPMLSRDFVLISTDLAYVARIAR